LRRDVSLNFAGTGLRLQAHSEDNKYQREKFAGARH
jgi:hypothetical protein